MNTDALKNRVQLIGRLGQDPEFRSFNGDRKMAKFSIATNDSYKNTQGEYVKKTEWHPIIAWGQLVTFIENYLFKGVEVLIEGKLTHNEYIDKTGEKRRSTQVEATNI